MIVLANRADLDELERDAVVGDGYGNNLREDAAHGDLVRREVRRLRPDAREAEPLGDRRHDGHCAIGGDGQHPVDGMRAAHGGNRVDVGEVHRLTGVGQ